MMVHDILTRAWAWAWAWLLVSVGRNHGAVPCRMAGNPSWRLEDGSIKGAAAAVAAASGRSLAVINFTEQGSISNRGVSFHRDSVWSWSWSCPAIFTVSVRDASDGLQMCVQGCIITPSRHEPRTQHSQVPDGGIGHHANGHGPHDVRMSYRWRMKACCATALPSAHVVGSRVLVVAVRTCSIGPCASQAAVASE